MRRLLPRRDVRLLVALCATLAFVPGAASADLPLGEGMLAAEHQLTPTELGDGSLADLEYGDPSEGLAMVDPPEASTGGGAELSHPLPIPPGRGRFEPD